MIDDKTYAALLQSIRDGDVGVGELRSVRVDGRWQTIDMRDALTRLVAERDDAIAQMNDADSATDNATQIAGRVVRELRQAAKREAALRRRLDTAHAALRLGMSHLKGHYPVPYKEAEVLATMQAAIDDANAAVKGTP